MKEFNIAVKTTKTIKITYDDKMYPLDYLKKQGHKSHLDFAKDLIKHQQLNQGMFPQTGEIEINPYLKITLPPKPEIDMILTKKK